MDSIVGPEGTGSDRQLYKQQAVQIFLWRSVGPLIRVVGVWSPRTPCWPSDLRTDGQSDEGERKGSVDVLLMRNWNRFWIASD